jgi:hypothetical protein
MVTVSEKIKGSFDNARQQIGAFEKRMEDWERKARESLDDVPAQLRGAWLIVIERLRATLDFATREEVRELSAKVEELTKKVDKLIRADKIRTAATKEKSPPKRA